MGSWTVFDGVIMTTPTLIEAVRNVSESRCERQGVQALWCVYAEGDAVYLELENGGRKRVATRTTDACPSASAH